MRLITQGLGGSPSQYIMRGLWPTIPTDFLGSAPPPPTQHHLIIPTTLHRLTIRHISLIPYHFSIIRYTEPKSIPIKILNKIISKQYDLYIINMDIRYDSVNPNIINASYPININKIETHNVEIVKESERDNSR